MVWWKERPGLLEEEFQALDEAGIRYERVDEALGYNVIELRLFPEVSGTTYELVATYPDDYPYFRPEVRALGLDLQFHQHPFSKGLCLAGRGTRKWHTDFTLASFVKERLPSVLEAGSADPEDRASDLEEHQGEPFVDYYSYKENCILLVDGSWTLPDDNEWGILEVAVLDAQPSADAIRGAVLRVLDSNGKVLVTAAPEILSRFSKNQTERGLWIQLDEPYRKDSSAELAKMARQRVGQRARRSYFDVKGGRLQLIGAVFPDEHQYEEIGTSWVFVRRFEPRPPKGRKRRRRSSRNQTSGGVTSTHAFIREGRFGPHDFAQRLPWFSQLQEMKVALFGVGCVGAPVAAELVKAGVDELKIVDQDYVDPATLIRWLYGLYGAGKDKVAVLHEVFNSNFPYTQVHGLKMHVGAPRTFSGAAGSPGQSQGEILSEFVGDCDLIIDCTAEIGIHFYLSDFARQHNLPFIVASGTHGAWGGYVARLTEDTGCWACLEHALDPQKGQIPLPPEDPGGEVQPAGCGDPTFTGAHFEMQQLSMETVRMAVSTLCDTTYGALDWDMQVLSLRSNDGAPIPPRWEKFEIRPHQGCTRCSG